MRYPDLLHRGNSLLKSLKVALLAVCTAFVSTAAYSQQTIESMAEAYIDQGKREYERGDYLSAKKLFMEAYGYSNRAQQDKLYGAVIRTNLALCYLKLSKDPNYTSAKDPQYLPPDELLTQAEGFLQEALIAKEDQFGTSSIAVAKGLENLASLYFELDKAREAEALYRKAISVRDYKQGIGTCDTGSDYLKLGDINMHTARFWEAEQLYNKAMSIWHHCYGPHDLTIGVCHQKLSLACYKQNHLDQAGNNYDEAVAIFKSHLPQSKAQLNQLTHELFDVANDIYAARYKEFQDKKGSSETINKDLVPQIKELIKAAARMDKTEDVNYLNGVLKELTAEATPKTATKTRKKV